MNKNYLETLSIDSVERLIEVSSERRDEIDEASNTYHKRVKELHDVIKATKSRIDAQRKMIALQADKLAEYRKLSAEDCSIDCVIVALERDIDNRIKLLERERSDLEKYIAELDEAIVLKEDTAKDVMAMDVMIEFLNVLLSKKEKDPKFDIA